MSAKSALFPLLAVAAALSATAAGAAPHGARHGGPWAMHAAPEARLEAEFRQLVRQYERAVRSGRLDRRDSARIASRLTEIDRLGARYARRGFNRGEQQRLERLLRETRAELRYAVRDQRWRDARFDDPRRGW